MASDITKMKVSIAAQVRAKRNALAFTPFAEPPGFHNTKGLRKKMAVFLSSLTSNSWGGKHGFLLLGLGEDKMRIVARESSLNCDALDKPELINPAITDETKGCDIQRLQEQQLGKWSDYLYQRVLYQVGGGNHRRRRPQAIRQTHLHTIRGVKRRHHYSILRPAPKMVRDLKWRNVENERVLPLPLERYPTTPTHQLTPRRLTSVSSSASTLKWSSRTRQKRRILARMKK